MSEIIDAPSGKKKKVKKIKGFYQKEKFVKIEDYSTTAYWNLGTSWTKKATREHVREWMKQFPYEYKSFGKDTIELNPFIKGHPAYINIKPVAEQIFYQAGCRKTKDNALDCYYMDQFPQSPNLDMVLLYLIQAEISRDRIVKTDYFSLMDDSMHLNIIFKPQKGSDIEGLFIPLSHEGRIIPKERSFVHNFIATGLEGAYAHIFTVHKNREQKDHQIFKYYGVYGNEDSFERGLKEAINNRGLKP